MKEELFEQLMQSIKEADCILKGEEKPTCATQIKTGDDSKFNDKTSKANPKARAE